MSIFADDANDSCEAEEEKKVDQYKKSRVSICDRQ